MKSNIDTRIENIRKGIAKRAAAMKAKVQKQGFQFKPFSTKQKKVLTWWCPASPAKDMDGSIPGGCFLHRAGCKTPGRITWRPPAHIPKQAARVWLGVTGVRGRLQDITGDGCMRRGGHGQKMESHISIT